MEVLIPMRIAEAAWRCSEHPALVGTPVLLSVQGICSLGFEIFTNTQAGSNQAQHSAGRVWGLKEVVCGYLCMSGERNPNAKGCWNTEESGYETLGPTPDLVLRLILKH